jgi:hypothetical protein
MTASRTPTPVSLTVSAGKCYKLLPSDGSATPRAAPFAH